MSLRRCPHAHHYDESVHVTCPACDVLSLADLPTRDAGAEAAPPLASCEAEASTTPSPHYETTDPVVGWLVCIAGPDRGRDYRIRSDRNTIGRGSQMDIRIQCDPSVSRDTHAVLTYAPASRVFRFGPGPRQRTVLRNEAVVVKPVVLSAQDVIGLGDTRLLFVPLCGADFAW